MSNDETAEANETAPEAAPEAAPEEAPASPAEAPEAAETPQSTSEAPAPAEATPAPAQAQATTEATEAAPDLAALVAELAGEHLATLGAQVAALAVLGGAGYSVTAATLTQAQGAASALLQQHPALAYAGASPDQEAGAWSILLRVVPAI